MSEMQVSPTSKQPKSDAGASRGSEASTNFASTQSQLSTTNGQQRLKSARLLSTDVMVLQRAMGNQSVAHLLGRSCARAPQETTHSPILQRQVASNLPNVDPHKQSDTLAKKHDHSSSLPPAKSRKSGSAGHGIKLNTSTQNLALIQRLAITDDPVRVAPADIAAPGYVKKSSGGLAGVYFARDGAQEIVIKFLSKTDALRAQYADMVVRGGTDLGAPDTKVYFNGTAQFAAISTGVVGWKNSPRIPNDNRLHAQVDTDINSEAVMLMNKLQGQSVDTMVEDPNQHATLVAALNNNTVIRGIAQLLVIDALLGNSDRLDRGVPFGGNNAKLSNIGNLFLSTGGASVVTLDNDAERIGSVSGANEQAQKNSFAGMGGAKLKMLQDVTSEQGVNRTVDALLDAIVAHSSPVHGQLFSFIFSPGFRNTLKERLRAAVAIERINVLTRLKSNKRNLKRQKDTIENAYGYSEQDNNLVMTPDWDTFRARSKLLAMRNKGESDAQALDKAFAHWQHKNKKKKGELPRQKAFKQVTSLGGLIN